MTDTSRHTLKGTYRNPLPGSIKEGALDSAAVIPVSFWSETTQRLDLLKEADQMAATPIGKRAYYTREGLQAKYPPDAGVINAVLAFARNQGLKVVPREASDSLVHVLVPASRVKDLFDTDLVNYKVQDGQELREYLGRTGSISVSDTDFKLAQAQKIQGVFGLDNRPQAIYAAAAVEEPRFFTEVNEELPYGFPGDLKGDNQSIGILGFGSSLKDADLKTVFGDGSVKNATIVVPKPFNDDTNLGSLPMQELQLDAQIAQRFVPNASKIFFVGPNTEQGWISSLHYVVSTASHPVPVLSISWGYFETEDPSRAHPFWTKSAFDVIEELLARATLLGITVCCASGDQGPGLSEGGPRVQFPASSQYVLACGGTQPNGTSEEVWCDSAAASGGGISSVIALPPWQDNPAVQVKQSNLTLPPFNGRRIPDVAAIARANVVGYGRGAVTGTSAAAPLWAALIVMANQQLQSKGRNYTVGNLTTLLYDKNTGLQNACTDICCGANASSGGCYQATPGWDACTGWGTPKANDILAALMISGS